MRETTNEWNKKKKINKKVRSNLSRTQIIGLAIMSSHQRWRYKCNQSLPLSRKPIIHCPFLMYTSRINVHGVEKIYAVELYDFSFDCHSFYVCKLYQWNGRGKKNHSNHTNRLQIPNGKISLPFHDSTIWIPQLSLAAAKLQV